ADPTVIFAKGYVKSPMQAVFHTPVISCGLRESFDIEGETGNEVSFLSGGFLSHLSDRLDHPEGCELLPFGFFIEPAYVVCDGPAAGFYPSVVPIDSRAGLMRQILEIIFTCVLEEKFDFFMEVALIPLKGKEVISALIDYLSGDLLLTSHGVYGHNAASDIEGLEQLWNCRNFIGFVLRFDLPQDQTVPGGPCANHMDTRFTIGAIMRATRGFSIDGHNIGITHRKSATNPDGKTLGEFLGIEQRENSSERVVRRNAFGQIQEGSEPLLFSLAEVGDLTEIVGAANDGAEGDNNDV
ncbi:MAG: hypothetical protein P4L61_02920, partial [Candidatus Pacebacteria bacterium]|nr:hypothetical protein [Candidatus Paceibacterota bacterium]